VTGHLAAFTSRTGPVRGRGKLGGQASIPGLLSRQIGSNGIRGVAVQAVAGMVVTAGSAGIFVAGVVLHVAQRGLLG